MSHNSHSYGRIIAAVLFLASIQSVAMNRPAANNTVVLQAGIAVPVRLSDQISTRSCQVGDEYRGYLASALVTNSTGTIVAPLGSPVMLRVVETVPGSHSSRPAKLMLELVSISVNGRPMSVYTSQVTKYGDVRTSSAAEVPASQVIYSIPGAGAWHAIAGSVASMASSVPTTVRHDVVLMPGQSLQFVLNASAAFAR